jgi:Kef-type K+ transport system membrane component KefB
MPGAEAFQLYSLLIILVSVLVFSIVGRRFGIPTLLGSVLIGILLGPSVANFIRYEAIPEWLSFLSLMGGMLILFLIGLETDIRELVMTSKKAMVMTGLGMFFPAIAVFILGLLFGFGKQQIILLIAASAVTATPTSLAIVLSLKKAHTRAATYLHASTILDNIVGIFFVFFLVAARETGAINYWEFARVAFVLVFLLAISYTIMPRISRWIFSRFGHPGSQTRVTIAFAFILLFGAISSQFLFEAAFGAFLAGVTLSEIKAEYKRELIKTITDIGEGLFFPLFFLTIGLGVNLGSLAGSSLLLAFLAVYILVSIVGKYMGGFYGGLLTGLERKEAVAIGTGMIPRGGIGLIVAEVGLSLALFTQAQFSAVVLMTFITTVVGVLLINRSFGRLE